MVVKFGNKRNLALLFLLVLCTQIVFIEGYEISPLKVAVMAVAPIVFLFKVPKITKAFIWGIMYFFSVLLVASMQNYIRFSTIGFLGMYIITFIAFYNLIHSGAFSFDFFLKLIKWLIYAFVLCLIGQQVCLLVGIRFMPMLNLINQGFLSITKLPSLTMEPSHTARILTVLMLAYFRCNKIKYGKPLKISDLFKTEHRKVTIGYLWSILTMGSGTGYIGLAILLLYFVTKKTALYIVPLFALMFVIASNLGIKQLDRALNVVEATATGDVTQIQKTDGSAATRIIPIVNTFTNLDLTAKETWLGKGTISKEESLVSWQRKDVIIGAIEQYGLMTYILSLIFLFQCCFRKILSLETIIFVLLLGCSISNIYYVWGILMIFSAVKYFEDYNEKLELQ